MFESQQQQQHWLSFVVPTIFQVNVEVFLYRTLHVSSLSSPNDNIQSLSHPSPKLNKLYTWYSVFKCRPNQLRVEEPTWVPSTLCRVSLLHTLKYKVYSVYHKQQGHRLIVLRFTLARVKAVGSSAALRASYCFSMYMINVITYCPQ
jgi:hypothetical protein